MIEPLPLDIMPPMNRYICIHSHFYQPPRENPWLEEVEFQDSAYPYHDWNERITAECYAPNTASRILGEDKRIVDIINNYAKMSFNFGPTLLSWIERHKPNVYQAILEADRESLQRFSGHGSAIAQAYNHMIMPLANERDVRTQVIWGIQDFEYRFKRKAEGMWLPETAVDMKTLEALAEHGIKFTILAPHQAKCVRKIGSKNWNDVEGAEVDPQQPYLCNLSSGRKIYLFFYDGPISQEIAFSELLKNGQGFAERLLDVFPEKHENNRMVHIATDGETYGHHHRYGEMALSYCLHHIESNNLAKLTVYGEYLEKYPVEYEVKIQENTAWSCIHGVERWKANCGCCSGGNPGWNQEWRTPLREALDWLRDRLLLIFEKEMSDFVQNPWEVRDQYIQVVLDRSEANIEKFFRTYLKNDFVRSNPEEGFPSGMNPLLKGGGAAHLLAEDRVRVLKLLEMQRHAMLMYTSCGWFFDEVSGIEATQIIQYASRAIQLANEIVNIDLEEDFRRYLERAPSNIVDIKNAAVVYDRYVKTTKVDLLRVGAHYAISSLFENYPQETDVYCYRVKNKFYEDQEIGKQKIGFGKAHVCSRITGEENIISFCVLHLGDHNLNGGVRMHTGEKSFEVMCGEIKEAFLRGDIPEVIHLTRKHFGANNYSLWHLFKYEQKKFFDIIFYSGLQEIEMYHRNIYKEFYPSMRARQDLKISLPKVLENTLEFVLNRDLLELLEEEKVDVKRLKETVEEFLRWGFKRDVKTLNFVVSRRIHVFMKAFLLQPEDLELLKLIDDFLKVLRCLALDLDVGKAQNIYFMMGKRLYKEKQRKSERGNIEAKQWIDHFDHLGDFLQVKSA